jgi:hypothetical protein
VSSSVLDDSRERTARGGANAGDEPAAGQRLQDGGGRGALSLGHLLGLRQPSLSGDRGRPMRVGGPLCEFASFALSLKLRGQRTQAGQLALRLGELGSERGELKAVGLLGCEPGQRPVRSSPVRGIRRTPSRLTVLTAPRSNRLRISW